MLCRDSKNHLYCYSMIVNLSLKIILVSVKINCLFRECNFTRFRYMYFWHLFPASQLQWKFVYLLSAMWSDLRIVILGRCYACHSLIFTLLIYIIQLCPEYAISFTLFDWLIWYARGRFCQSCRHFVNLLGVLHFYSNW
jgi:hypothetical protein